MDVIRLINCIKRKNDCEEYFQQLRSVKSSDFAEVTLNKIIWNLREIIDYEFQKDCNNDSEKIANVIYEGILNSSSMVGAWSYESKTVAALLKHWFNLCNELQKHDFDKWWKHFAKVLSFIEESGSKHQSISELVLLHLTGDLLELVIAPGLPWSSVKRILKTLTCCAGYSSRQLRAQLSASFQTHFVQLAHLLVKCGDEVGQSLLLETLLRFLKLRSDRNSRMRAAKLWFPQTEDWKHAINFFHDLNFSEFDTDCRIFLNAVNQVTQLVTSVACHAAYIGDLQLRNVEDDPNDLFWVDFNHGPRTLSLSSDAQYLVQASVSSTEVWETITIDRRIVTAVELVRSEAVAEMRMSLHSRPDYVSVLSRASIQTHGHSMRLQFRLDSDLRRVNRALADIFSGIYKEVDKSTIELWIRGLYKKKCSIIVKHSSTSLYRAKRPRLSDSSDDADAVVGKAGPSRYSPHMMQPPQFAGKGRSAITPKAKVSRAVRKAVNNNVCATPAMSVASSTSTTELAQLPEKLRQYDSAVYTKELDTLAQSPALTNITEEASSALHSVAPSLHSLSSHCTHMPGVFKSNITFRQNDCQTHQKSIPYEEEDISLLDKTFEDDYKQRSASQMCNSNDMIVENILREAFMKENTKPKVVLKRLDKKVFPQTILSSPPPSPKSQLSNNNLLPENTKVQSLSSDEFLPEKTTLKPNSCNRTNTLNSNFGKLKSQLSKPIKVLKPSHPNIPFSESEKIHPQLSQTKKPDENMTNINVTVEQSSELDNPDSQLSKPDKLQKLSCESYENSDSGIIVTGISNSQHNSLLKKNNDHKEYSNDVSVILDTPDILHKSVDSKLIKKSITKKSASKKIQKKILKSKKRYVADVSDDENDVPEPELQRKTFNNIPNSVNNGEVIDKKETIVSGGSFQKLNEIDLDNFFNQNESNSYFQTTENPDIARRNNLSSSDTDNSESNFALNPLTTPHNVHVEDLNTNVSTPKHFVTVAEESNDDSVKNIESLTSSELESRKTARRLVDIKNSARSSSIDSNLNTPYSGEKKRRKLYSPKDTLSSFQFENPQNAGDKVVELIGGNQISLGQKLRNDTRFNYTSTTSFDDKVTERKGKRARSRIRNKKLFAQSNTTNYTKKQLTKELKKTSEERSSVQENDNIYTFSEDSKSNLNRIHRNKRSVKNNLKSKKQIQSKSVNKWSNHTEDSDSTDEFKPSKVTPEKRLFGRSINRAKKVVDDFKNDLLQDERMREAQAHCDSIDLNHSLLDSDIESPQENCLRATIERPHQVLQMETNHYENKLDGIYIQMEAEPNQRDVQTEKCVEILSERSDSSSDELLIKKAKRKNMKYMDKKPTKNCTSNKMIDTSNDTLPSLIIESNKQVDVDGDINKVFQALQDQQEDLKIASLNNTKITKCCESENRDRVTINPSAEDLEVEFIFDKTWAGSNDSKKLNADVSLEEHHSRDRNISSQENPVINLDKDVSESVILVEDVSETLNLDRNNDYPETRESINKELESFDTVGMSPIRAHRYYSEDIAPSVRSLDRTVSPRVWEDDKIAAGSSPDKLIPSDKDVMQKENYFLETTTIKTVEKPHVEIETHNVLVIDNHISSPVRNENTKSIKPVKESQHSIITCSGKPTEKLKKKLITGNKNYSKVVQQSILTDGTKKSGFPTPLKVPQQDLVNRKEKKNGELQRIDSMEDFKLSKIIAESSKTNSKKSKEVIVVSNNNILGIDQRKVIKKKNNLKQALPHLIATKHNHTKLHSTPPRLNKETISKNEQQESFSSDEIENINLIELNNNVQKVSNSSPCSQSSSLLYNLTKMTEQITPIPETLSPSIENVKMTEFNSYVQKLQNSHTKIHTTPPRLNKETILKNQQDTFSSNEIEKINTTESNEQKFYDSSPCSRSSGLYYDVSKMKAQISPVPETLSPPIAQKFLKRNTYMRVNYNVVEIETENDSVVKQKAEGDNTLDTSRKHPRQSTEDSIHRSSQNVNSLSQNSVDTEIKDLVASISQQVCRSSKLKCVNDTDLSQSLARKDLALRNSNSSTCGHTSILPTFPVLSEVVIGENCNEDSLSDNVLYRNSVEKPTSSNVNSAYVTNWLNNIPEQNNNEKRQTLEQFLDRTFKQLMETFENKMKENEEESKRRWRTAYTAVHQDFQERSDQLDLLWNQLQKCCEKNNALQHTWKHTVVENVSADAEDRNAVLTSIRDLISVLQTAITDKVQHENDDYFE